jgi:hypothetical protein
MCEKNAMYQIPMMTLKVVEKLAQTTEHKNLKIGRFG